MRSVTVGEEQGLKEILAAAVLACQPGDRLVDWSDKIAAGIQNADVIVTVEPLYTRLLVYDPEHPQAVQRCCNGKAASVLHLAVTNGRFCVGQSQPQMKWSLHLTLRPGISL
jgi:hypothetical protein